MRRHAHTPPSDNQTSSSVSPRSDRETLSRLWPYLWQYKWRVVAALSFMVGAKLANVGVPLLLKELLLAHHLLRDTVTRLFTNEKKVTFEDIKPTSERYDQRLRLLAKYRDLIENREADYAPLLANKEQGHD